MSTLELLTVRLAGSDINVTSKAAERAGAATALGEIVITRRAAGPLAHDETGQASLSIITPTADPVAAEDDDVYIAAVWDLGDHNVMTTFYGRVEAVTVRADFAGRWIQTFTCVDRIAIAADRPVGITRPSESTWVREVALRTAHPDLLSYPPAGPDSIVLTPPTPISGIVDPDPTVILWPLTADTSVLDAIRDVATARGDLTATDHDGDIRVISRPGDDLAVWWGSEAQLAPTDVPADALIFAPSTTSRATKIGKVSLTLRGADGEEFTTDYGSTTKASASLNVETAAQVPLTAVTRLLWQVQSILDASINWPAPMLDPVTADIPDLAGCRTESARLIRITPAPQHCGAYHWVDGHQITIHPDWTVSLKLTLTPAHMLGLVPIRHSDIPNTVRLVDTRWQSGMATNWTRLGALACARPPYKET